MKKHYLAALAAGLISITFAGYGQAGSFVNNITIYDGDTTYLSGETGIGREDNEAETGMVQSQAWDLEGFYLDGTILTMVGGYNFLVGLQGFTSGDIFISTGSEQPSQDQPYIPGDGNNTYSNETFDYEYALDIDWNAASGATGFDVIELAGFTDNDPLLLEGVWYDQNESNPTSNPWRYLDGGTELAGAGDTYSGGSFYSGDAINPGLLGWDGNELHYYVQFDLTNFLGVTGLWGEELFFHFTMGCGNDNMLGSGSAPVPEPATMLLLGSGLAGLAGVRFRRRGMK